MIGALAGLGRVVGREMAEEALGRIIAGRTAEDVFARQEIARRIGQKSFDLKADAWQPGAGRRKGKGQESGWMWGRDVGPAWGYVGPF